MELLEDSGFVKPYYIDSLGCDGLTCADIAKSLGTVASKIRRKLEERDFLDRLKKQNFRAVPFGTTNKTNGLDFTEYALDVDAARFFVAKYNSDLGDAYLTFLINLEKQVTELNVLTQHDPILRSIAETQRLRLQQILLERQVKEHEDKINSLEDNASNMPLNTIQKKHLKKLIDSTGYAFGDPKFIGRIQRDLKEHFDLNASNDKWYHIAQKDYKKALDFVKRWGLFPKSL